MVTCIVIVNGTKVPLATGNWQEMLLSQVMLEDKSMDLPEASS